MEIIPFVTGGGVKKGVRNGSYRLDQVKSVAIYCDSTYCLLRTFIC